MLDQLCSGTRLALSGALALAFLGLACVGSEGGRESERRPDATPAASQPAAGPQSEAAERQIRELPARDSEVMAAYEALVRQLEPLRIRAFQDTAIARRWDEIMFAMEERLAESDPILRSQVERKYVIEDRFARAERHGEAIPDSQRLALIDEYQAIQNSLTLESNRLLQSPEFSSRLADFQLSLYRRMRELDPRRAAEIDSLQTLVQRLEEGYEAVVTVPAQ